MLVAAAVCPHPPLLLPTVGVGLGADIDELRDRCQEAVDVLWASPADRVYVVGAGAGPAASSFAPWAPGSPDATTAVDVPEPLPLPLLVGAHLTSGRLRSFVVVDPLTESADCVDLGRELAESAERVALLVMGDGAARHDVKAPGYVDARAAGWDESVHGMFAAGDLTTLATLDVVVGDELLCAGRPAWQVLAGAATDVAIRTKTASLTVPFGVGYHVASWVMAAGDGMAVAK